MARTATLKFKDAAGTVIKTIRVGNEARIHTSSPRVHLDEIKNDVYRLNWSTGLLKDIEFEDIVTIEISR